MRARRTEPSTCLRSSGVGEVLSDGLPRNQSIKTTPDTVQLPFTINCPFFAWPEDVGPTRLSARGIQATLGDPRFDALLIAEPASKAELATIWPRKATSLC